MTWVDTSKLKRTIMKYNDEVRMLCARLAVLLLMFTAAGRLRPAMSVSVLPAAWTAHGCIYLWQHHHPRRLPVKVLATLWSVILH